MRPKANTVPHPLLPSPYSYRYPNTAVIHSTFTEIESRKVLNFTGNRWNKKNSTTKPNLLKGIADTKHHRRLFTAAIEISKSQIRHSDQPLCKTSSINKSAPIWTPSVSGTEKKNTQQKLLRGVICLNDT